MIFDDSWIQFVQYRWEFMRRNEKYQKDYEELEKSVTDMSIPSFCAKWNIMYPIPPQWSYDDLDDQKIYPGDHRINNQALILPIYDNPVRMLMDYELYPYKQNVNKLFDEEIREVSAEKYRIKFEVDLSYSKAILSRILNRYIDVLQKELEREHGDSFVIKRLSRLRKYHYANFEIYLRVYDLRKAGRTWNQIKEELNLNDIHTARDHYKAASKLVDQGLTV